MTKKQSFINLVENLIKYPIDVDNPNFDYDDAMAYFEGLKNSKEKEKVPFTENGKKILTFMKENCEKMNNLFKSKEIAEGLFVSSRSVSGAMRKLITDGYVESIGESPASYSLTDSGIEVKFN